MIRILLISAVVIVLAGSGGLRSQTAPSNEIWKLNVKKSKYEPGPPPKSQTRMIQTNGKNEKYEVEGVTASGNHIAWTFDVHYDDKDYPIRGLGAPRGADTIAVTRLNPNTTQTTLKKAGKVVQTARNVVSKDRKVLTITVDETDASGKHFHNVNIFERQ